MVWWIFNDDDKIQELTVFPHTLTLGGSYNYPVEIVSERICELDALETVKFQTHNLTSLPECLCNKWSSGEIEIQLPQDELNLFCE